MKKSIILSLVTVLFTLSSHPAYSQEYSENGQWLPARDTIRVLLVFAEAVNDPNYNNINSPNWPAGQMPLYPESFIDVNASSINAFVTQYFHQASYGEFILLADYLDTLIQVEDSIYTIFAYDYIAKAIDELPFDTTANGYNLTTSDFDNWSDFENYLPKTKASEDWFDVMVVLWRVNSALSTNNSSGGSTENKHSRFSIPGVPGAFTCKGKIGTRFIAEVTCHDLDCRVTLSHELAHGILGANSFHTGNVTNKFTRTFKSMVNGYSMLSTFGAISYIWNGFDRWRLGWKHPSKSYLVSAIDANTGLEVDTENFSLGNNPSGGDFILRDVGEYGDAIRVELPYITDSVFKQYLWLENHGQSGQFGFTGDKLGLYPYIQVGKDDKTDYYIHFQSSPQNYTYHLFPSGRHDFIYNIGSNHLEIDPAMQNPLTGYHLLMTHALDLNDDDTIAHHELSGFSSVTDTANFSGLGQAYRLSGNYKLNMNTNPAPVPVKTYNTTNHSTIEGQYNMTFYNKFDNKQVQLNGLSIEILEEEVNPSLHGPGAIKVRVKWDHFDLGNDVRWCGNILLSPNPFDVNEPSLNLLPDVTLLLDRGHSPTKHLKHDDGYFTNPTVFTLDENAYMQLGANAKVIVENRGTFVMEPNTFLDIGDYAVVELKQENVFTMQENAYFHLDPHAKLIVDKNSTFILEPNSFLEIHEHASVELKQGSSFIIRENAELHLHDLGSFIIGDDCEFIVEKGAYILLNGAEAVIENNGLIILEGDSFTFQTGGEGYIRFKNWMDASFLEYNAEVPNVLAKGQGVKIKFEGNNMEKRLEVEQGAFIPSSAENLANINFYGKDPLNYNAISEVIFYKCSVELGTNAFLSIGSPLDFSLSKITKIPATGGNHVHGGLVVHGQEGISVSGSEIEHGKHGIRALMVNSLHPLVINSTAISNCETGLYTLGGSVTLTGLTLEDNQTGWKAVNLSGESRYFNGSVSGNATGIFSQGVAGSRIEFRKAVFTNNDFDGLKFSESTASFRCCGFSDHNTANNSSGIVSTHRAVVNLSQDLFPVAGFNLFDHNSTHVMNGVYTSSWDKHPAEYIFLNNGRNSLAGYDNYAIEGYLYPHGMLMDSNFQVAANRNSWDVTGSYPVLGTHYLLGYPPLKDGFVGIIINDDYPLSEGSDPPAFWPCENEPAKSLFSEGDTLTDLLYYCGSCRNLEIGESVLLNEAVLDAIHSTGIAGESNSNVAAIEKFNEILTCEITGPSREEYYLLGLAYLYAKKSFVDGIYKDQIPASPGSNTSFNLLLDITAARYAMEVDDYTDYINKMNVDIDRAHLYRHVNDRATSLSILEGMLSWIDDEDKWYVNRQHCLINLEHLYLTGHLNAYELLSSIDTCTAGPPPATSIVMPGNDDDDKGTGKPGQEERVSMEKVMEALMGKEDDDAGEITGKKAAISIQPHPVKNESIIKISLPEAGNITFSIVTTGGKTVFSKKLKGTELEHGVSASSFSPGMYFILLSEESAIIKVEKLVITE